MLIDGVVARMDGVLAELEVARDPARHFLATYRRVTVAVGALVPSESRHLVAAAAAAPGVLDRLLLPVSRAASARLLRGSREQVWANTDVLLRARRRGPGPLGAEVDRLEDLATQRVQDLLRPRHPLLHLARHGFGVRLAA